MDNEEEYDCTTNKFAMEHKGDSWWEYDAQGIPLCKVCDYCVDERLGGFRPEILSGYSQADVDEPIEEYY